MDEFILLQCNAIYSLKYCLIYLSWKQLIEKIQHAFHILLFTIFPVKKLYKL